MRDGKGTDPMKELIINILLFSIRNRMNKYSMSFYKPKLTEEERRRKKKNDWRYNSKEESELFTLSEKKGVVKRKRIYKGRKLWAAQSKRQTATTPCFTNSLPLHFHHSFKTERKEIKKFKKKNIISASYVYMCIYIYIEYGSRLYIIYTYSALDFFHITSDLRNSITCINNTALRQRQWKIFGHVSLFL